MNADTDAMFWISSEEIVDKIRGMFPSLDGSAAMMKRWEDHLTRAEMKRDCELSHFLGRTLKTIVTDQMLIPGMAAIHMRWLLDRLAQHFVDVALVPPPRSQFAELSFADVLEMLDPDYGPDDPDTAAKRSMLRREFADDDWEYLTRLHFRCQDMLDSDSFGFLDSCVVAPPEFADALETVNKLAPLIADYESQRAQDHHQ